MELLSKLGIDWRLLIAQIINFLILLLILYKFLYKPILHLLESRKEKIERGLQDAIKLEEELAKTKEIRKQELEKTKKEALQIIEQAQKNAELLSQDLKEKTKKEAEKIILETKSRLAEEKGGMMLEIKKETAALVVAAAEKVVGKIIDEKIQHKFIEDTLNEISKK
jgi:F-type H+-transporting ATPase subunit b